MGERPYSQEMLELGEKWIAGTITPEEKKRLFEWYDNFNDTELTLDHDQSALFQSLKPEMLQDIRKMISPVNEVKKNNIKVLTRISMVAAVMLLLVIGGWLYTAHGRTAAQIARANPPKPATRQNDIGPGTNKATLTLADGSTVLLDSAGTGNLARQGNSQVIKNGDGQLQYAAAAKSANSANTAANNATADPADNQSSEAKVVYNILSTPRGGQYRLKLQDGTNVWLNAGSSIRYPTSFTGKVRKVEITGEAYFEVAQNADMPFRVSVNDPATGEKATGIEVLGTGFNVNAYIDETDLKTTLIEGAVRVTRGTSAVTLKPSQQAIVTADAKIRTTQPENIEQIVAWKNGAFEFDNADIPTIMRQISRWYDVDVEYQGQLPNDRFTGRFSRNTSLAGILQILHISGVQLAAENKKIVIKS